MTTTLRPARRRHDIARRCRTASLVVAVSVAVAACSTSAGDDADDPVASPPASVASNPKPPPSGTVEIETTDPPPATTSPAPTTDPSPTTDPAPTTKQVERADPSIFDYEAVRPVGYEVIDTITFRGVEMLRIKFESPLGGMAYGYMSLPVDDPVPGVGILWAHGAPVDGTDSFDPMSVFACGGATSIVVDAPYARPGALRSGEAFLWTSQDRDEQIQLVVDMRRALDLLTDLGTQRFGMSGISYGGAIGGQLIGVDDRIEAALLLLGDGGVVERFTDEDGEPTWEIAGLSESERQAWFEAMLPIEPSRYISDSDAKILFMNGLEDPLIPPAEAKRYHASARPGYEVYWMDVGHDISFPDFVFHNRWLGEQIGLDPDRLEACTHEVFPNGFDNV